MSGKTSSELVRTYTRQLLSILSENALKNVTRKYGFEYEFLPRHPITAVHVNRLKRFLLNRGFSLNENGYISTPSELYITFEAGGQIEYSSPPMGAGEESVFQQTLTLIDNTNRAILEHFGIEYLAVGYLPGRSDVQLCVPSRRYRNLHALMQTCGARGKEMLKATASVHLHVSFQHIREILPLFRKLAELASAETFRMSRDRCDIWDDTDPTRRTLPLHNVVNVEKSKRLIEELVRFALDAKDIYTNMPFWQTQHHSFHDFCEHLTTIYTDVRLNLKGPTLELRTLDSLPLSAFELKWKTFVNAFKAF